MQSSVESGENHNHEENKMISETGIELSSVKLFGFSHETMNKKIDNNRYGKGTPDIL